MTKKPHILFLGSQMEIAGAQAVLLAQARWFSSRGYPVTVAFFYDKEGIAEQWATQHEFDVLNLHAWRHNVSAWRNALRLTKGMWRLFSLLKNRDIEIIETFTPHSNLLGLPLAWLAGVPVRMGSHHGVIPGFGGLAAFAHQVVFRWGLGQKLIAVSEQVRGLAIEERIEAQQIEVIANGLALPEATPAEAAAVRRELNLADHQQLLLNVGRLTAQKAQHILLKAFAKLRQTHPDVILAIAGDGELYDELHTEAEALKTREYVHFLGVRNDIPALLTAADAFVLSSVSEGLPIALLEAMGAGKPVVVSDLEGLQTVVEDQRTGLLFPTGDFNELAAKLAALLDDGDVRSQLGQAARKLMATEYSIETMCQQYELLFLQALTRSEKPPIFFLGSQMEIAGAQEVLLTHARWFHKQGYPVAAAFFYDKEGLVEQWDAEMPFPVINLRAWSSQSAMWRNLFRLVPGLWRLWRELRSRKVKIIETFTPHSNLLGVPVAWFANVPVRMATHHGFIEGSSEMLGRWHGRLINWGFATSYVAVSAQVRELTISKEGAKSNKVQVIENGIEPLSAVSQNVADAIRADLAIPNGGHLLLTVGRLTIQKGHTYLIDAMPEILAQYPHTIFAFAGDGILREELRQQADGLGVLHAIRFLGVRRDIPALLQAADIFVMPSLWEGLPMALLEAMSLAKPVVISRVEGVADVIVNGENGLMVEPKDINGLVQATLKMLQEETLRKAFGSAGQILLLDRYTVDQMCKRYEENFMNDFAGERA